MHASRRIIWPKVLNTFQHTLTLFIVNYSPSKTSSPMLREIVRLSIFAWITLNLFITSLKCWWTLCSAGKTQTIHKTKFSLLCPPFNRLTFPHLKQIQFAHKTLTYIHSVTWRCSTHSSSWSDEMLKFVQHLMTRCDAFGYRNNNNTRAQGDEVCAVAYRLLLQAPEWRFETREAENGMTVDVRRVN